MIPNWDDYFMQLIEVIATRSKDPNTQIGCVIVAPDNTIRSTGYNSFPRGIKDTIPERLERPEKYLWIEHADRNAIYSAAKAGVSLDGCRMYLPGLPCMDCARGIIQVGIVQVIYDVKKHEKWAEKTALLNNNKWSKDWKNCKVLFAEAGVRLTPWQRTLN
jgi:dCMP deaminase